MTPGIILLQLTIKIDHFMPGIPENGCGDILMQTKVLPSFRLVNPEMFATFVMVSFQKSPTNISNDMTKNLILAAAMLLAGGAVAAQPKVIAHRGYWTAPESAQNSIASFTKADAVGVFGSEIDVWLTADNQLVVNHDSTFKGVNMQKSTAQQCTAVILDNGEQLPTLRQYLEKAGQLKTRLILELKSHKTPEQETRAVESIVKMVKDMAFSRHATKEFIRLTPKGTPVYYLEGDLSPKELKEWGCAGPDYHFSVFKRHPEWIKESHDLGMKVNAWTINDAKDMKWLIDHGVDFITTNVPVELQEILQ